MQKGDTIYASLALAQNAGTTMFADMEAPRFLVGQLLLAMPGMGDPRFERAAIAMCVHDDEGAFGLIVSHVFAGLTVRDLMEQIGVDPGATSEAIPVYAGGPVEPQRGFVLHSLDYDRRGTISVAGRWGMTASLDILKDIASGNGPAKWHAVLGYTGWAAGQLDDEMTRHGWLAAPGDPALVFAAPYAERWGLAYAALGVAYERLSPIAGRA